MITSAAQAAFHHKVERTARIGSLISAACAKAPILANFVHEREIARVA